MHGIARFAIALFVSLATALPALAADEPMPPPTSLLDWPPHSFYGSVFCSAVFGLVGIVLALVGFKLFDWLTPGDMQKEIIENKNLAAAIITAAMILGICHILAAAIH
jgi:Domain of Unknown Function (DUF350)